MTDEGTQTVTDLIIHERLVQLDHLTLRAGAHGPDAREYCFNEAAAWLAGEPHSDAPNCVSPVLRRYTMALNDRWGEDRRQTLKPYLPRVIGTRDDGKDQARVELATRYLVDTLLGPWLRLAGMDEQADSLAALTAASPEEIRSVLYRVRSDAWKRRDESRAALRAKVKARLLEAADAAAAAVAAAAAAAVADAAAVAAAAAADVADAAADAAAAPWRRYDAAYAAARQYFRDNPLSIGEKVQALAAEQQPLALVLLDQLIDPPAA